MAPVVAPLSWGGHAPSRTAAKCACRVDPSTSGGAAESTSSMCVQPSGGAVDVRATLSPKPAGTLMLFTPSVSPYFWNSRSVAALRSTVAALRVKTATKAATDLHVAITIPAKKIGGDVFTSVTHTSPSRTASLAILIPTRSPFYGISKSQKSGHVLGSGLLRPH